MDYKYDAFIFNPNNDNPIDQILCNSISELRYMSIKKARGFNGKGGRIKVVDRKTGRTWRFNS